MLALCLLIILFNYLGMNQTLNLIISSALFGIFITWYYKGSGLCIALFSFFYWAMF
ncbi:putative membrane protein, partial [Acinetobacter baumannii 99063]